MLLFVCCPPRLAAGAPENLAQSAIITGSGHLDARYEPRLVADGKIPPAQSKNDVNRVWCLPRERAAGATLTFTWPAPVKIREVVYYGRTAWLWNENFKAVEIIPEGAVSPAARQSLKAGHGPQRIALPETITTGSLTLKFPAHYGGPNPGASEIRIYGEPPSDAVLGAFSPPKAPSPPSAPASAIPESAALLARCRSGDLGFRQLVLVQRHPITPSHVYTYHCEGLSPGGGLYLYDLATQRLTRLIDASQGIILDCDLSYDGRELLFSWKQTMDAPFQVFRIGVDGAGLTRLTDGEAHNYNACWLPDGGIGFLSTRKAAYAYCWASPAGILHRMESDGSRVNVLSANYLNDFTPAVMPDGRLIYGRWEYVDRPAIPTQSLWTINPDGTGLRVYFGNRVLDPGTFIEPHPIPGTQKLLCILTGHNGSCRGAIGVVDRRLGMNAQAAIENLTPEINIGRVDRGNGNALLNRGPYESPMPIDDRYFLVSRKGTVLVRDYAGTELAELLRPQPLGWFNARPLRPHPRPPVVAPNVPETRPDAWAAVCVQDVYQGLSPEVERGEIAEIAVVQEIAKPVRVPVSQRMFGFQFPVVSCGATYAPKKVWGYARVEPDGSAYFRVPAEVPLYFMVLDRNGRALQRMRSFTHLARGEVQACIGCHENRRATAKVGPRALALRRPPQDLRPPPWGVRGFSYVHVVQPVLDRHCGSCHSAVKHAGGVDLSGDRTDVFCVSYEVLARQGTPAENWRNGGASMGAFHNPYTSWIPTYNGTESNILEIRPRHWGSPVSRLAELVHTGHPDAEGRPRIALSADEARRIYQWIDLNVPYYGTSSANYLDRRGCRLVYPPDLDRVLAEVAKRRCAECHKGGHVPRTFYTRITHPENNSFLLAPLAAAAGGTEACGQPVFASREDPDYQSVLKTFQWCETQLRERPRKDVQPYSETVDPLAVLSVGSPGVACPPAASPPGL